MDTGVIYARFSSHGQNEQSIEAQVRICKECAEKDNIKIVNVYSDKARTGTNDARPAFQRMIADAKSGAFQYIVVYMFDRFASSLFADQPSCFCSSSFKRWNSFMKYNLNSTDIQLANSNAISL